MKAFFRFMFGSVVTDKFMEESLHMAREAAAVGFHRTNMLNVSPTRFELNADMRVWHDVFHKLPFADRPGWPWGGGGITLVDATEDTSPWYRDWLAKQPSRPASTTTTTLAAPQSNEGWELGVQPEDWKLDENSRRVIWTDLFGNESPPEPICGFFEVALPSSMNFVRLVLGEHGELLAETNAELFRLVPAITVKWERDDRDESAPNAKKLVVGFRPADMAVDPELPSSQRDLRYVWHMVMGWVTELYRGYPVPLGEWFAMAASGATSVTLGISEEDLLPSLKLAYLLWSRNPNSRMDCMLFEADRAQAVLHVRELIGTHGLGQSLRTALCDWIPDHMPVTGAMLLARHMMAVAVFEWHIAARNSPGADRGAAAAWARSQGLFAGYRM